MIRRFTCEACLHPFERDLYPCEKDRRFCSPQCSVVPRRRHNLSHTPIYRSWKHMIQRCQNTKDKNYPMYGARGICVCERWQVASNFIEDMGERPEGSCLERIDNNGNYEPANCRWATRAEQNRNKRNVSTQEQDRLIREGIASGLNFVQIAKTLGKSPGATSSRAYRMGLKSGQAPGVNMIARPASEHPGNDGKRQGEAQ